MAEMDWIFRVRRQENGYESPPCGLCLNTVNAARKDTAKKLTRISMDERIPIRSARKPVKAVKTTPPIPVAKVMIPVAVAVRFPASGSMIVRTHG